MGGGERFQEMLSPPIPIAQLSVLHDSSAVRNRVFSVNTFTNICKQNQMASENAGGRRDGMMPTGIQKCRKG